jgi:hypothetical protein
MHERWKIYGRVLLAYLIVFILVLASILYINWDYKQELHRGVNKVINDFGHFLSVLIIWVYLLVFIWISSGIGFVISYIKKRKHYQQILGIIFILSSVALALMTIG